MAAAALAAFDQVFPDQEERENAWVALADLEEGKSADQQLAGMVTDLDHAKAQLCSNWPLRER